MESSSSLCSSILARTPDLCILKLLPFPSLVDHSVPARSPFPTTSSILYPLRLAELEILLLISFSVLVPPSTSSFQMFFSSPVFKKSALAQTSKVPYPKKFVFSEILPLCSKNTTAARRHKPPGSSCTQELQALFGCLKKWEFDDLPCAPQHKIYNNCVQSAEKAAAEFREAAKKGALGEGSSGTLSATQFNKISAMFPQPDLGKAPFRQMKRLPEQNYADDIFRRKHMAGKAS
uniref:CHCH domain-containing protein n=1 Tax=Steinernema glaseri TaxID=37863 RepID=A0A1I7Z0L7_9BILA